jgi:DNA-binding MarR family transcriptional regulator
MTPLTGDGKDGRYTTADLAADLSDLIAMGLVAVTGSYPDLRYVVTPEGQAELARYEAEVRAEARELARARRAAGQLGTVVPLPLPNGA